MPVRVGSKKLLSARVSVHRLSNKFYIQRPFHSFTGANPHHDVLNRFTQPLAFLFDLMHQTNQYIMNDLLYIIAIILIIGWLLGAFVFSVGSIIHVLLVIAVVAILLRLIRGRRV